MTLNDFLDKCRKKGTIPLSYERITMDAYGNKYSEGFENAAFTGLKPLKLKPARIGEKIPYERPGMEAGRTDRINDLVSRLYGREVVIHDKDGYHYGRLAGYDGKMFQLQQYHSSKRPIDESDYFFDSLWNDDNALVPINGVVSIKEMPFIADNVGDTEEGRGYEF